MFLLLFLVIVMMVGMAAAGYYLLDYLVQGEEIPVPNLYGMTKTEALETLLEHDLYLKLPVETFPSPDTPPDIVIEQRPYPNTPVKKRRAITITLSVGAEELLIPDVVGQFEVDAVGAIRTAGLEVGQHAKIHHPQFPDGMVIAQDPPAGKRILYSKKVNMLVSLGPKATAYVMKNYLNMNVADVLAYTRPMPFRLAEANVRYVRTTDSAQWNLVMEQRPLPGARITEGEQISLTVAASGEDVASMRMANVVFPIPPVIDCALLKLLVWDDYSQQFGLPVEIPLHVGLFQQEINEWVPVFGDALIMLVEPGLEGESRMPRILDSQYVMDLSN